MENGWHVGVIAELAPGPASAPTLSDGALVNDVDASARVEDTAGGGGGGGGGSGGVASVGNTAVDNIIASTASETSTHSTVAAQQPVLLWMNEAGAEWDLCTTSDPDVLATGSGNPYHDRYPEFVLHRDATGEVTG